MSVYECYDVPRLCLNYHEGKKMQFSHKKFQTPGQVCWRDVFWWISPYVSHQSYHREIRDSFAVELTLLGINQIQGQGYRVIGSQGMLQIGCRTYLSCLNKSGCNDWNAVGFQRG